MKTLAMLGALAACASAWAVSVETSALRVDLDDRTGGLVSVVNKETQAVVLRGEGEDLWEFRLMDGSGFGSTACASNGVTVTRRDQGVCLSWSNDLALVRVYVAPNGADVDLTAGFVSRLKDAGEFKFPINLHFNPVSLKRMVFPGGPHVGLGFSFHGDFFARRKDVKPGEKEYWWHGDSYPNCHADFWALDFKDGSSLAGYGVQPRPKHEPWQNPVPFMRTQQNVGGTPKGGRINHVYMSFSKPGVAVRLPAFRLSCTKGLQAQLDAYAKANDIGKPLREKVDADTLDKLLHGPLNLIGGTADEIISCLPYIPSPALIHTQHYMHSGFDKRYPDILPPNKRFGGEEGLKRLIEAIHARGMLFMPYTNPTWWSEPKGPTFEAAGETAFWRDYTGKPYHEKYGKETSGWRTTFWHPAVRKVNRDNVIAFKKAYGVDVLFQDQVGGRGEAFDFNPSAPTPTAYVEGLLSMAEEDARDIPLGCEDGWDRVADVETALFGGCWRMFPVDIKNPDRHPDMKRKWPSDLWEYEPVLPRLMRGNVLFYMHDLGQFVRNDRVLAWHVAYAYCLNATYHYNVFSTDNPHSRWYKRLCAVQRDVISRIAAQPVVSFVHDRKPMLARDDISHDSQLDDGTVVAQYGATKVYVNLGDVTRPVGPYELGPYGWRVVGADGKEISSDKIR